ncbi:hypothetical protein PoB_001512900 [Plakobranchus ocellatus]|uniref:Uncharacterized protein n=1 Tax=Plakobranchus ocellatus TaxID=259542 RepID=A0AAV3Z2K8_9GAST|nr:hypothetical protein PoB_001512900 [Plakobranchus ocellatus]
MAAGVRSCPNLGVSKKSCAIINFEKYSPVCHFKLDIAARAQLLWHSVRTTAGEMFSYHDNQYHITSGMQDKLHGTRNTYYIEVLIDILRKPITIGLRDLHNHTDLALMSTPFHT